MKRAGATQFTMHCVRAVSNARFNSSLKPARMAKLSFLRFSTHTGPTALYAKGSGAFGALGLGDSLQDTQDFQRVTLELPYGTSDGSSTEILESGRESAYEPTPAPRVTQVACGWGHSAAVTSDGYLHIFGRPYDFSNILQINRIRAISPGLGRFVGRFTNWFGSSDSDDG